MKKPDRVETNLRPESDRGFVIDSEEFCDRIDEWARLMCESERRHEKFRQAWFLVRLAIRKSCLLSRTIYHGERPSQTPCPVHEGKWSGIHAGWPGERIRGRKVKEDPQCRKWYEAGCRCFQHTCGCTTGWQPDEYCGCFTSRRANGKTN